MTKEFYNRMLLMSSLCLLSFSGPVSAQCVTPPTCSELGYTKSVADCEGHTFLKCPFNQTVGYCDLGTSSTPVPEPEPTPTYKVGDDYAVNNAVIGKVIAVNNNSVTIASQPRSHTDPSYANLTSYCQNLTLGGGVWYAAKEKQCQSIKSAFNFNGSEDKLILENVFCSSGCSCTSTLYTASYYVYYYTCIASFAK